MFPFIPTPAYCFSVSLFLFFTPIYRQLPCQRETPPKPTLFAVRPGQKLISWSNLCHSPYNGAHSHHHPIPSISDNLTFCPNCRICRHGTGGILNRDLQMKVSELTIVCTDTEFLLYRYRFPFEPVHRNGRTHPSTDCRRFTEKAVQICKKINRGSQSPEPMQANLHW